MGWNELSFRTSSDGSFLRLNDETVIEVPVTQLIRRSGRSELCIGFRTAEDEHYSIAYTDLRTRFVTRGASRTFTQSGSEQDAWEECFLSTQVPSYIASDATDSWMVLDFIVSHATNWAISIIYHDNFDWDARDGEYAVAHVAGIVSEDEQYRVRHYRWDDITFSYLVLRSESAPAPPLNIGRGAKNRLEFETSRYGTSIFLNGKKISEVPVRDLNRQEGTVKLCALTPDEGEPQVIRIADLWAWAD